MVSGPRWTCLSNRRSIKEEFKATRKHKKFAEIPEPFVLVVAISYVKKMTTNRVVGLDFGTTNSGFRPAISLAEPSLIKRPDLRLFNWR